MPKEQNRLQDVIKQRAYGMWLQQRGPTGPAVEDREKAKREASAGQEPFQQHTNPEPTAPPVSGERPGASSKLGGTPGDLSRDEGRQMGRYRPG